jgi:putative heme iron utilization protein
MLTLAESARTLTQQANRAMLSTLSDGGTPYGSIIEIAPTGDGDIIMLLSQLAEHQRYLLRDPRASVLIAPSLHDQEALAKPRVTLMGEVNKVDIDDVASDAYLERHPDAASYLSLGDFHFYQLRVEHARYIAGFGRMGWLAANSYRESRPDLLWEISADAIEHMNVDHRDNLIEYARSLAGVAWAKSAQLRHIDRYGLDIVASGDQQSEIVRVNFEPELLDCDELRPRLIAMAQQARAADS